MSKKYVFDELDTVYDDTISEMLKSDVSDIDIVSIKASVKEKIHASEEKKKPRSKRIVFGLIAAVLVSGIIFFAVGMAEYFFNMDNPLMGEMRNEVILEDKSMFYEMVLERDKKTLEHPEKGIVTDYGEINAELRKKKIIMIIDILKDHGYETKSFNSDNIYFFENYDKFDLSVYCRYLTECIDAVEDENIGVKDRVRIELQLEEGLMQLSNFYFEITDDAEHHQIPEQNMTYYMLINQKIGNADDNADLKKDKIIILLTNTRDNILKVLSRTAFAADVTSQKSVLDYRDKLKAIYGYEDTYSDSDFSDQGIRLYYLICASDYLSRKEAEKNSSKIDMNKIEDEYIKNRNVSYSDLQKELEQKTGEKYEPDKLILGQTINMEGYITSEYIYRNMKEPYEKMVALMSKYHINTNITYEQLIFKDGSFDIDQYRNFYEFMLELYNFVKKHHNEMTWEEKEDLFMFLTAIKDYPTYNRARISTSIYYHMVNWAKERNIPLSKVFVSYVPEDKDNEFNYWEGDKEISTKYGNYYDIASIIEDDEKIIIDYCMDIFMVNTQDRWRDFTVYGNVRW